MHRLTLLFFLFSSFHCLPQSDVSFAKEFTIHSEVLKETRQYFVRLPSSYENDNLYINKRYPVLVLLDADTHFLPVSGLVHALSVNDEVIPEMIIVAIQNKDRSRDMKPAEVTGKSSTEGTFIKFIETELLKEIDQRFRTLPFRLLAGHSLAGLFTIDCFLNQHSFNAYVAIDPSLRWGNEAIIKKADSVLQKNHGINSILYTAQSRNPFNTSDTDPKEIAFKKFEAILAASKSERLTYKNEYFENEDHFSIPSIAFYRALLFVFDGFKIPPHVASTKSAADIMEYYKQFQKHVGAEILPPGKLIDQIATYFLNDKKIEQAIELMRVNEMYYRNSFVTHQSLGDAFRAKGNVEMAIKYYNESLRLNSGNDRVKKTLKELSN
jgi:predicted alpha/beta superfamily hydrolase